MIRLIVENLILFFAPTLIYLGYIWLIRDSRKPEQGLLDDAPIAWLAFGGAALVLATLVLFGQTSGGKPDDGYVAPTVKDGKLVPGHKQ
jgi:hypothetical protein